VDWFINSDMRSIIIFLVWGFAFLVLLLAIYCFWLRFLFNLREKKKQKLFSQWEEEVFKFLEEKQFPREFVKSIPKSDYSYFLNFLENYLTTLKGEDFERISSLITHTELFSYLCEKLKYGNKQNRSDAAYYLGLARASEAKTVLKEGLKDRDDSVVFNCALALAKIGAVEMVGEILRQYHYRKNYSLDLLLSLFTEFGSKVCPHLLQHLPDERNESFLILIVDLLGHFRYYSAGEAILKLLKTTSHEELKIHCIKSIGRMEYIEALPILREYVNDPNWVIRNQAIIALGKIGDVTIEKKLIENLEHEKWWVRYRSAEAIFNLSEQGEEILKSVVAHSQNKKAVTAAQVVLTEKEMGA